MYLEALAVATSSEEVRRAAAAVHDTTALPNQISTQNTKELQTTVPTRTADDRFQEASAVTRRHVRVTHRSHPLAVARRLDADGA